MASKRHCVEPVIGARYRHGSVRRARRAPAAESGGEAAAPAQEAAAPAEAAGGTLTFGRYADSLFLDPVLNDANLDIWVLNSLYDTLLQSTQDGQDVIRLWPATTKSRTTACPSP